MLDRKQRTEIARIEPMKSFWREKVVRLCPCAGFGLHLSVIFAEVSVPREIGENIGNGESINGHVSFLERYRRKRSFPSHKIPPEPTIIYIGENNCWEVRFIALVRHHGILVSNCQLVGDDYTSKLEYLSCPRGIFSRKIMESVSMAA